MCYVEYVNRIIQYMPERPPLQEKCTGRKKQSLFTVKSIILTEGDSGFRIQDSGFRIQDSGFRIQDSGFRIQDSGFRIQDSAKNEADGILHVNNFFMYDSYENALSLAENGAILFEKLRSRIHLPKRRRLTRKSLLVIILLTLIVSFAIAWDKTIANQRRLDKAIRLLAAGKYEESLDRYNRVLFWWPHSKLALTGKGLCELNLGLYNEAVVSYSTILENDPAYVVALQGKSWGLEHLGRIDEALRCYEDIQRIKPGVLDAARQIDRLRKLNSIE